MPPPRRDALPLARRLTLTTIVALLSSCDRPVGPAPYRPEFSSFLQARGAPTARDLPTLPFDLPPAPRPWESSGEALAAEIAGVSGRAFVILRDSGRASSKSLPVTSLDPMSSGRQVVRGIRQAIASSSVDRALASVERTGAEILAYYERIGVALVVATGASVAALLASPWVDQVEPQARTVDRLDYVGTVPKGGHATLFAQATPWGIQAVGAPLAWSIGATGSGARLLVVDQGHDQGHEDLPAVPTANCFGVHDGCDDHPVASHGTHVLGVASARNNGIGVVGMAPSLAGVQTFVWGACDDDGVTGCPHAEQLAALNWAAGNLGTNGVINMSLGGAEYNTPVALAAATVHSLGIVIVASAGITGSTNSTIQRGTPT